MLQTMKKTHNKGKQIMRYHRSDIWRRVFFFLFLPTISQNAFSSSMINGSCKKLFRSLRVNHHRRVEWKKMKASDDELIKRNSRPFLLQPMDTILQHHLETTITANGSLRLFLKETLRLKLAQQINNLNVIWKFYSAPFPSDLG